MRDPLRLLVLVLVAGLLVALVVQPLMRAPAATGPQHLDAATAQRTFSFAAGSSPADERVFLQAVAAAQPPARRLIDLVDGLVSVSFGRTPPGELGHVRGDGTGYQMTLDL